MEVLITIEQRFDRTPDGTIWTGSPYHYSFWVRYLSVFEGARVVARVRDVDTVPSGARRAEGPGVSFHRVPYYLGPWQYLLQRQTIRSTIQSSFRPGVAIIMRVASQIATDLFPTLRRCSYPFALEVVGDPHASFSRGAIRHPLRPLFASWFRHQVKQQLAICSGAAYVTRQHLQQRYPPNPSAFTEHYSSVSLGQDAFASHPRTILSSPTTVRLVNVANFDQMYKGHDILLDACAICVGERLDLELVLVGDGRYRRVMEDRAVELGVADRIRFTGQLSPGRQVREVLDTADLFVLPSRTEGLPRALIEAMARGLPCIGSAAGGIPELLPPDDIVPRGDASRLAREIAAVLADSLRMTKMSARNLNAALQYSESDLSTRRNRFYRNLRDCTAEALRRSAPRT